MSSTCSGEVASETSGGERVKGTNVALIDEYNNYRLNTQNRQKHISLCTKCIGEQEAETRILYTRNN